MTNQFLGREGAPFGADIWEKLDETLLGVARSELSGRRLLAVKGPFGLGLKNLPLPDEALGDGLFANSSLPLTLIQKTFTLSVRDVAAFTREPIAMNLGPLVEAAYAAAQAEDGLIFDGTSRSQGLLNLEGATRTTLTSWDTVGSAQSDLIAAVTALDEAGVHGPYTLALAPRRYNQLLRPLETGRVNELDLVKQVVSDGIVKAPALRDGGVLIASGSQYAHLVIGQDMSLGFLGPTDDGRLAFSISESLALRVPAPAAVCVLG
jgi:uncharacterized linocin/CFP29 family protein